MQRCCERAVESPVAQKHGLDIVGNAQPRRHVGLVGKLDEDALAGSVDRADPAAFDERNQIGTALAAQARADALAQFAGGATGEGDGEHLRRQVVPLGNRSQVALHEYRRLARAGAGIHEDTVRRLDGGQLRRRQRWARTDLAHGRTRQIPL